MVVEVVVVVVVGNQRNRHRKRGENAGSRALILGSEKLRTSQTKSQIQQQSEHLCFVDFAFDFVFDLF